MAWQDWVISFGQIILAVALIPTIRNKNKPPLSTSLTTASVIGIISLTFSTLGLWFSAATAGLSAALWFVITYQTIKSKSS